MNILKLLILIIFAGGVIHAQSLKDYALNNSDTKAKKFDAGIVSSVKSNLVKSHALADEKGSLKMLFKGQLGMETGKIKALSVDDRSGLAAELQMGLKAEAPANSKLLKEIDKSAPNYLKKPGRVQLGKSEFESLLKK